MQKVVVLDKAFPKHDDIGVARKDDPRLRRLAQTVENRDGVRADHLQFRQAEIISTEEEEEEAQEEEEESEYETDSKDGDVVIITMIKYVSAERKIETKKAVVDEVRKDKEIRKNLLLEEANIGKVESDKFVEDTGESEQENVGVREGQALEEQSVKDPVSGSSAVSEAKSEEVQLNVDRNRAEKGVQRQAWMKDYICVDMGLFREEEEEENEDELLALFGEDDPEQFEEAVKYDKWRNVMEAEIKSMEHNNVWELVGLLEGAKVIGVIAKHNEKGDVGKLKARSVSKYMENSSKHIDVRYHFEKLRGEMGVGLKEE